MNPFWFSTYIIMSSDSNDYFVASFPGLVTMVSFSHLTSLNTTPLNGSKDNVLHVSSLNMMFAGGVGRHVYEIEEVPL